jgi:pyruvoyl-dependent arginine decarboxylase (PvlArgDC)
VSEPDDLRALFHTLNNQLGIILSHAELLEAKAKDDAQRDRATQVVTTTLEALTTTRQIRHSMETSAEVATAQPTS